MHVLATAGHVDHGKSTLVRALTGMEPDRWAEERRRGMTIDLGYAWTSLPCGGPTLAFVDVPGHQRFIGNMLAGLGPAPAVLFVVAADEGWRRQSAEHLAAIDALNVHHGLLAVTRCDLADPASALREAQAHLARTSLGSVEAVAVSGATGHGLNDLRAALGRLVARLPDARTDGRVRLWVDRAFTVRGSGTVVTGTLESGHLTVGDELELHSASCAERAPGARGPAVRVRGLQSLGRSAQRVDAVSRVAVNLRGIEVHKVRRGDVLGTPGAWRPTATVDARLSTDAGNLPAALMLHVGTAVVPARLRALDGPIARLTTAAPLPLLTGDRAILRDPAQQTIAAGVLVLDVDPPPLRRRGSPRQRASVLRTADGSRHLGTEVALRGAVRRTDLKSLGVLDAEAGATPAGVKEIDGWLLSETQWHTWQSSLLAAVDRQARLTPLDPRMTLEAARRAVGVPDPRLLRRLAGEAGLEVQGGRVSRPGVCPDLGAAEAGVRHLEERLFKEPFRAPEHAELVTLGLGPRELAAAVAAGRLLRLAPDVALLPGAPALAMRALAALDQPFSVSQARQAWGTTRRVALPLLAHLDARAWTVRIDATLRRVAGSGPAPQAHPTSP